MIASSQSRTCCGEIRFLRSGSFFRQSGADALGNAFVYVRDRGRRGLPMYDLRSSAATPRVSSLLINFSQMRLPYRIPQTENGRMDYSTRPPPPHRVSLSLALSEDRCLGRGRQRVGRSCTNCHSKQQNECFHFHIYLTPFSDRGAF